jgi:hypothetical protein
MLGGRHKLFLKEITKRNRVVGEGVCGIHGLGKVFYSPPKNPNAYETTILNTYFSVAPLFIINPL